MGRKILAVLAGILAAVVIVFVIEFISSMVYPPPPGMDMSDMEAMKAHVQTLPTGAFIFVLAAWTIAAFVGGLVAGKIAKSNEVLFAWIVGGVLLIASIANLVMIPHPVWFSVTGIVLILVATFMAGKFGQCRRSTPAA